MQHALELSRESAEGVEIINLGGALDTENMAIFKTAIDPLCAAPGTRILLDCTNLTYVNSACFGLFNKYHGHCQGVGSKLAFCGLTRKIMDIMKLLGLSYSLAIYATRAEALKALAKD